MLCLFHERAPYSLSIVYFPPRIPDTGGDIGSTCTLETGTELRQQKLQNRPVRLHSIISVPAPFKAVYCPNYLVLAAPSTTTFHSPMFSLSSLSFCRRLLFSSPTMVAALKLAREVYNPLASLFG